MTIPQDRLDPIMDSIENRIRHAYNCGYEDGYKEAADIYLSKVVDKVVAAVENGLKERDI